MDELEKCIVEGLSARQREAVVAPDRYLRIMAGAGAGKTETLTRRIVWLLARGWAPGEIVAFTFTERAAASMKDRIHKRVAEILGPERTKTLGEMFVGTIHAYAARLLQDHFGYGNWDVADDNQEMAFLLQRGWELGLGEDVRRLPAGARTSYSEYVVRFKRAEAVVCHELLELDTLRGSPEAPEFPERVRRYWDLLDQHHILTFDRMVRLAAERLRADPGVAGCRHLLVDEYQDINHAQQALIWALARAPDLRSCTVVGDPRQCIYEWRGSDPGCFDRFAEEFSARTVTLQENRRSARAIIDVANAVARHFPEPALRVPMEPARRSPGVVVCQVAESAVGEARSIAGQIRGEVEAGRAHYGDFAVLLRSVSTSGPVFIEAFRELGIPYIVGGKVGLFQRPEARAMAALWLWFGGHDWRPEPYGPAYSGDALLGLAEAEWPGGLNRAAMEAFAGRLRDGAFHDLTEAYQTLLAELGYLAWNPDDPEDAVRMANLGRFSTLLVDYQAAAWRGGRSPKWPTLLGGLAWYIKAYAQGAYADQQADDLPQVDAVHISTVHQAKGLEWPVVFVAALVDSRFPSSQMGREQKWLLARDLFDAARYEGGENAERRLFYVAVTRARDTLVLSRFERASRNSARPSRFLREGGALPEREPAVLPRGAVEGARRPEDEVLTLSVEEILTYLRCPHQYRMRHVWGYEAELARELGYGRAVHHVLRLLARSARDGADPEAVLVRILEDEFFLPYAHPAGRQRMIEAARRGLTSFVRHHGDILYRADDVEARLEFLLSPAVTVAGRADVLVAEGGGLEVIDYKTAPPGEDGGLADAEADLQVQLYAAALRDMGRDVRRARVIHVLGEGHPARTVPVDSQSLTRARQQAEESVRELAARRFPARAGKACRSCDVRRICSLAAG